MGVSRRDALVAVAAATAGIGLQEFRHSREYHPGPGDPQPFYGGPNSAVLPDRSSPQRAELIVHWSGVTTTSSVALTFDDGPDPTWTPEVLKVLHDADVPATFFLQGRYVKEFPSAHANSAGRHELANHTWDHPDLSHVAFEESLDQLRRCSLAISDAYGVTPTLFRPPYGHLGGATLAAAAELGLEVTLWSAHFKESAFADHPEGIIADVAAHCTAGSIILGHDRGTQQRRIALDRLPQIIDAVKARGLRFVTVSELIAPTSP